MIYIGNHVSLKDGYFAMGKQEKKLGGDTFAFFTRNPRGGNAKERPEEDFENLRDFLTKEKFGTLVAHAPYTMNLAGKKDEVREFGQRVFKEDLQRMELLPGNYFNFHPGSHTGLGKETGTRHIQDALNNTLFPEQETTVLIETMAGKGTEIGSTFEELARIIEGVRLKEKVGVCFDTCHVWDAGYDIKGHLDEVLDEFDKAIGIERLLAVHLNDSKNPCGSRKDRHEKIGLGMIGDEALERVVTHPLLQGRPFILETPNDDEGYRREIEKIRNWIQ